MTREMSEPVRPPEQFVRFSLSQRVEHLAIMVSFTLLVVTGLPQKFFGSDLAQAVIQVLGGIETTRAIHRTFGIIFCLEAVYHFGYIGWSAAMGRLVPSMLPSRRDARDALGAFAYATRSSSSRPLFDRFDYRQKFEYWGVILGGMIVIITGLILMFPVVSTQIFPGVIVPAAREMHGGEAILAFSIIVTWHLYGAHLNPHHFPGDSTIFTGRISRKRMIEEHPREYARITGIPLDEVASQVEASPGHEAQ